MRRDRFWSRLAGGVVLAVVLCTGFAGPAGAEYPGVEVEPICGAASSPNNQVRITNHRAQAEEMRIRGIDDNNHDGVDDDGTTEILAGPVVDGNGGSTIRDVDKKYEAARVENLDASETEFEVVSFESCSQQGSTTTTSTTSSSSTSTTRATTTSMPATTTTTAQSGATTTTTMRTIAGITTPSLPNINVPIPQGVLPRTGGSTEFLFLVGSVLTAASLAIALGLKVRRS